MYYATFDEQGNRITSYVMGMHKDIPSASIQISDADQALYATNDYIRGADGKPIRRPAYVPTLEEVKAAKLTELDQAAATAYVSGFYSAASGTRLYYDSDPETQTLLTNIYSRTKEADWETKIRYPGIAPAGQAAIRARINSDAPDTAKTVQLLDARQVKMLIDDLDTAFFRIKSTLWRLQTQVAEANTVEEVESIVW